MFVMRHCVATTKRTEELGEESDIEETSYEFDPPYLWEQFVTKWRIGTMIDCGEFRDMLGSYHIEYLPAQRCIPDVSYT